MRESTPICAESHATEPKTREMEVPHAMKGHPALKVYLGLSKLHCGVVRGLEKEAHLAKMVHPVVAVRLVVLVHCAGVHPHELSHGHSCVTADRSWVGF